MSGEISTGKLAETMGTLLSGDLREDQKRSLNLLLDHISQSPETLSKIINFPISRFYGRTVVHLAAVNGLPEYLEKFLMKGGKALN